MKKKLFVILFVFVALNGFAQENSDTTSQKIFKRPYLEKFYGTWVYEKDGQYFRVMLTKTISSSSPENPPSERLIGTHIFKKNGKVVDEKSDSDILSSINNGNLVRPNENLITFRFHEYRRAVSSHGTMEYVDGPVPKLIWKLNRNEYRRGIILPGQENLKDPEFIVPTDITLYKVK